MRRKGNYLLAFGLLLNCITYIFAQDGMIHDPLRLIMYGLGIVLIVVGLMYDPRNKKNK